MLKVIKPGVFTTIQDLGRQQYRAYGVPVSGAMDRYAFNLANKLLGNDPDLAAIEIMYGGAEFVVLENVDVSITGANLKPMVDGKTIEMWSPIRLLKGQRLSFQGPQSGVISYVAMAGGVNSPVYLNSQSIYEKAGFGRPLTQGDRIKSKHLSANNYQSLDTRDIPTYTKEIEVNIIPSHHEALFKPSSLKQFYSEPFILKKADRMGAILKGSQPIKFKSNQDIVSEAVTFGTVQVPPSGNPMILLADAQTTGGYPTLGSIISEDLWRISQIPPNGRINFNRVQMIE